MSNRSVGMVLGSAVAIALGIGIILALTSRFTGADTGSAALSADHTPVAALGDLNSVEELSVLFNEDAGSIRLVLLLSPT